MFRREMSSHQQPHEAPQQQQASPPQSYETHPEYVQRRIATNPAFAHKLSQMRLCLSPLVQVNTGWVHPAFPQSVLHFWLLTDSQLEGLASFYHQRTPSTLSRQYPCPIKWRSDLPLEEKRRKIGRFIGLRGCESPIILKTEEEIAEEARMARLREDEEMWRRKNAPW